MSIQLDANVRDAKTLKELADACQRNFEILARAANPARPHAQGTATLSFVANNDASVTFNHGLKGTPTDVQVTPRSAGASSIAAPACTARTDTQLTIEARTRDGLNATVDVDVDWDATV